MTPCTLKCKHAQEVETVLCNDVITSPGIKLRKHNERLFLTLKQRSWRATILQLFDASLLQHARKKLMSRCRAWFSGFRCVEEGNASKKFKKFNIYNVLRATFQHGTCKSKWQRGKDEETKTAGRMSGLGHKGSVIHPKCIQTLKMVLIMANNLHPDAEDSDIQQQTSTSDTFTAPNLTKGHRLQGGTCRFVASQYLLATSQNEVLVSSSRMEGRAG